VPLPVGFNCGVDRVGPGEAAGRPPSRACPAPIALPDGDRLSRDYGRSAGGVGGPASCCRRAMVSASRTARPGHTVRYSLLCSCWVGGSAAYQRRQLQLLSGIDQVGVLDDVVGL